MAVLSIMFNLVCTVCFQQLVWRLYAHELCYTYQLLLVLDKTRLCLPENCLQLESLRLHRAIDSRSHWTASNKFVSRDRYGSKHVI